MIRLDRITFIFSTLIERIRHRVFLKISFKKSVIGLKKGILLGYGRGAEKKNCHYDMEKAEFTQKPSPAQMLHSDEQNGDGIAASGASSEARHEAGPSPGSGQRRAPQIELAREVAGDDHVAIAAERDARDAIVAAAAEAGLEQDGPVVAVELDDEHVLPAHRLERRAAEVAVRIGVGADRMPCGLHLAGDVGPAAPSAAPSAADGGEGAPDPLSPTSRTSPSRGTRQA